MQHQLLMHLDGNLTNAVTGNTVSLSYHTTEYVGGRFGSALKLNGSFYTQLTSDISSDYTSDHLEFWVKTPEAGETQLRFMVNYFEYLFRLTPTTIAFELWNGTPSQIGDVVTTATSPGWHHILISRGNALGTYSDFSDVCFFVDGVFRGVMVNLLSYFGTYDYTELFGGNLYILGQSGVEIDEIRYITNGGVIYSHNPATLAFTPPSEPITYTPEGVTITTASLNVFTSLNQSQEITLAVNYDNPKGFKLAVPAGFQVSVSNLSTGFDMNDFQTYYFGTGNATIVVSRNQGGTGNGTIELRDKDTMALLDSVELSWNIAATSLVGNVAPVSRGSSANLTVGSMQVNELLQAGSIHKDNMSSWKAIEVIYKHVSGQKKRLFFYNDGSNNFGSATLSFSSTARVGSWVVSKITISDYDGGFTVVRGNAIANASLYDVFVN